VTWLPSASGGGAAGEGAVIDAATDDGGGWTSFCGRRTGLRRGKQRGEEHVALVRRPGGEEVGGSSDLRRGPLSSISARSGEEGGTDAVGGCGERRGPTQVRVQAAVRCHVRVAGAGEEGCDAAEVVTGGGVRQPPQGWAIHGPTSLGSTMAEASCVREKKQEQG
jgi:hypothetical protein